MDRDRVVTMSKQKSVNFFFRVTEGCGTPSIAAL
jgi:hypothetical protein